MRPREIVEHCDVDEDADQASRETKDPRYDANDGEDHGDGSSPRLACPQTPGHDESQYSEDEYDHLYTCQERGREGHYWDTCERGCPGHLCKSFRKFFFRYEIPSTCWKEMHRVSVKPRHLTT